MIVVVFFVVAAAAFIGNDCLVAVIVRGVRMFCQLFINQLSYTVRN